MGTKKRLEILDALRGLAALAVVWYHLTRSYKLAPAGSWLRLSGEGGFLGVEVFFVISGFIILYSMSRDGFQLREHFWQFVLKRVVRLDPPYIVSLAITLAGGVAVYFATGRTFDFSVAQLLAHFGYANAFLGYEWINGVYWTLAIEFQFYVAAALLSPFLLSYDRRTAARTLAMACLVGMFIPSSALLFRYAGLFVMGFAAFFRRNYHWGPRRYYGLLTIATLAASHSVGPVEALAGALTSVVVARADIPRVAVLSYLGAISYSLYLVHIPVGVRLVNLCGHYFTTLHGRLFALLLPVAASIIVAHAVYVGVERPALRLASGITYRRAYRQPLAIVPPTSVAAS